MSAVVEADTSNIRSSMPIYLVYLLALTETVETGRQRAKAMMPELTKLMMHRANYDHVPKPARNKNNGTTSDAAPKAQGELMFWSIELLSVGWLKTMQYNMRKVLMYNKPAYRYISFY